MEEHPELFDAVSKDVNGEDALVPWFTWDDEPVYALTLNHPTFRSYLVDDAKKAIDLGVDAIYVDGPTYAALISTEDEGAGFADVDIAAYEADPQNQGFPYASSFERYRAFHERLSYAIVTEVLAEVRRYAASQGRPIAISANLAGLGALTGWSRIMAPVLAKDLDFLVFEAHYASPADPEEFVFLPEGRFSAYHKLGRALMPGGGLVAMTPSVSFIPELTAQPHETYLEVLFAEAFAFESGFLVGAADGQGALVPDSLAPFTRFVKDYHALYEGARATNAVAVVYANQAVLADPAKHASFVRCSQALSEANVQHDAIYTGDSEFAAVDLDGATLARYATVIVPTANALTPAQVAALSSYAASGAGRLVVFEPCPYAFPGATVVPGGLAGAAIAALVPAGQNPVRRVAADRVVAAAYLRAEVPAFVVHLVNYDYDLGRDAVAPKQAIAVEIAQPLGFDPTWQLRYLAPGGAPATDLPYTVGQDGVIRFEVPALEVYGVAVFSAQP